MITNQIIQATMAELGNITHTELGVYDSAGKKIYGPENAPDRKILVDFADSPADSQVIGELHLLKAVDEGELLFVVTSRSLPGTAAATSENAYMIGKIAVSELKALSQAYKEQLDRNNFYQNLILDNLLLVDVYNRAKKLRIETTIPRVVFLVEVRSSESDSLAMELLKGMYTQAGADAVTSVDENTVIVIKSMEEGATPEALKEVADTIVSLLNTEAMLSARVSYGSVVSELKDVSKSYKEAKMALEVGRIFYAERNVVAYSMLGIGRLIYQLPVNLCQIYIREIFGEEMPKVLDEETRNTLNKFLENNLNVSETARQLYIHRNTLVFRIEKVLKETGLDVRVFEDALTYRIAMMVEAYLKDTEKRDGNY